MPQQSSKSKAKKQPLNPAQKNFCRMVVSGHNGTQAAIGSGYTPGSNNKSAGIQAVRLLADVRIKAEIERLQNQLNQKMMNQAVLTRETWISEMAKIGIANHGDYAKIDKDGNLTVTASDKLSDDQKAAISSITQTHNQFGTATNLKLHDKQKALTEIGKAQGWYIQPSGDGDGNGPSIQVTVQMPSNGRDGQQSPKAASAVAKSTW